jgi:hypothetical protein
VDLTLLYYEHVIQHQNNQRSKRRIKDQRIMGRAFLYKRGNHANSYCRLFRSSRITGCLRVLCSCGQICLHMNGAALSSSLGITMKDSQNMEVQAERAPSSIQAEISSKDHGQKIYVMTVFLSQTMALSHCNTDVGLVGKIRQWKRLLMLSAI